MWDEIKSDTPWKYDCGPKQKKRKKSKKTKKFKCTKWKHDFSWKGKKKHKDICCRYCGKNMVEWIFEREAELSKKIDCAGRSMGDKPIKYFRGPAPNPFVWG